MSPLPILQSTAVGPCTSTTTYPAWPTLWISPCGHCRLTAWVWVHDVSLHHCWPVYSVGRTIPMAGCTTETCIKGFLRHWIACFGVPGYLMSDRGPQFTSELQTELNRLLGISASNTTAYHPQANGLVERMHRQLKASLKASLTGPKWIDELPMILLGIRTAWREDPECSLADLVYGTALHLLGEFFNAPRTSDLHSGFLRELQNSMHTALPPPLQYHCTRPTHIPGDLGHTSFVYIRHGAHCNPLQRPYAGPFPVLERNEKYWVINHDEKIEKVTVDHLKTAYPSPVEPLLHPTAASQLPVPTACRPQTRPPQPDTAVPLPNSQFLQHVDHRLGHHSQILQYLFPTPSSYSMSTTDSATTARYCSTSSQLPVPTACRPQTRPPQPDTAVPLHSQSRWEIRPRDRLIL